MSAVARHWAGLGEVTFVGGIRLLYALHRRLGRWPFLLALYPVVSVYWLLHGQARAASRDYLRHAHAAGLLPRAPRLRDSLRHFLAFADAVLDKLLAASGAFPTSRVRIDGIDYVEQLLERGRGGLFVTAHVGCLELCQATAERVPSLRLTVLVHTRHAERFNALLAELRPQSNLRLLQVTELGPGTAQLLDACVARGEWVAIVGDRVSVTGTRSVPARFLGREAPFPAGPWVLAALLRCPVVLLACVRETDGYRVSLEPFREQVTLPRRARDAALAALAADYAAWLERLVRRAPYQWFNFFRFWDQPVDGHAAR